MKLLPVLTVCLAIASSPSLSRPSFAQTEDTGPAHEPHAYTEYEKLVFNTVTQFHKNFDNHEWDKNGPLVADNLHVNSNGTELNGRDAFIQRIARFAVPFPDVKIADLNTIVDGNKAAIRFVITGTQTGDLPTPTGVLHATNRKIKVDGVEYFTFNKDGKLVDLLTVEDLAGMMRQLTAKQ
jgi:predicted ester cyclase